MKDDDSARGYVICSEPRSGSEFLCSVLSSTGMLGKPNEYFSKRPNRALFAGSKAEGVADLLRRCSSANCVYGFKIFSYQFDLTERIGWASSLRGLRFVSLEREDLLGQAISFVRARQTESFGAFIPEAAPPHYDGRAIRRELHRLAVAQARWKAYFARNGLRPVRLSYEAVVADPQAAANAIAGCLELPASAAVNMSEVRHRQQRDDLSCEWRERFLAGHGNLDTLDKLNGRLRPALRKWRDRLAALR